MAKKESIAQTMVTVRPKELIAILHHAVEHNLNVLIVGPPGAGKTDIALQVGDERDMEVVVSHPVLSDPTDAKGIPWPSADKDHATFLPFGEAHRIVTATKPTLWLIDDMGQAAPATQASFMPALLHRRIGDRPIPPCVRVLGTTNRRDDKAGVSGMLEPVKSRFHSILHLTTHIDDFAEWYVKHRDVPEVLGFLRFRTDLLSDFKATADIVNSPCPRTWAAVAQWVKLGLPSTCELATYAGAVGPGAASEFLAFLEVSRECPDPESIIRNPEDAPIPEKPAALYATMSALAYRASSSNFRQLWKYVQRLHQAKKGEFGVLLVRDSIRRDEKITGTETFTKLAMSDFGKLIMGQVGT